MDLLYPIGTGSRWKNCELLFSLRSIAKNLKGVERVFVVGERPDFLTGKVTYIPCPDVASPFTNPTRNVIEKIRIAIKAGISENFLLMNDDFIILKTMSCHNMPLLHKGCFSDYPDTYWNATNYRQRMRATYELLLNELDEPVNFGVHVPFEINVTEFERMYHQYDWDTGIGHSFRSIYGNVFANSNKAIELSWEKRTVYKRLNLKILEKRLAEPIFLAFSDHGLNNELITFLTRKFSSPSQYEVGVTEIPQSPFLSDKHPRRTEQRTTFHNFKPV